jgi:hypothetical protein
MANPEHVNRLTDDVAAWNQWREENPTAASVRSFHPGRFYSQQRLAVEIDGHSHTELAAKPT